MQKPPVEDAQYPVAHGVGLLVQTVANSPQVTVGTVELGLLVAHAFVTWRADPWSAEPVKL
jgi:hypothetical protein